MGMYVFLVTFRLTRDKRQRSPSSDVGGRSSFPPVKESMRIGVRRVGGHVVSVALLEKERAAAAAANKRGMIRRMDSLLIWTCSRFSDHDQ
jgi:hypothetical protein